MIENKGSKAKDKLFLTWFHRFRADAVTLNRRIDRVNWHFASKLRTADSIKSRAAFPHPSGILRPSSMSKFSTAVAKMIRARAAADDANVWLIVRTASIAPAERHPSIWRANENENYLRKLSRWIHFWRLPFRCFTPFVQFVEQIFAQHVFEAWRWRCGLCHRRRIFVAVVQFQQQQRNHVIQMADHTEHIIVTGRPIRCLNEVEKKKMWIEISNYSLKIGWDWTGTFTSARSMIS